MKVEAKACLVALSLATLATPTPAGWFGRPRAATPRPACPGRPLAAPSWGPSAPAGAIGRPAAPAAPGAAYGPVAWRASSPLHSPQPGGSLQPGDLLGEVNAARARAGLPALAADPGLASAAASNNAAQASRGLGHHVNPGAWQAAGAGYSSPAAAVAGWLASPAHRAIVLRPEARVAGAAMGGAYSTLNVR